MIKINVNYSILNSSWENLRYSIVRGRGHYLALMWDRFKWHWFPRLNRVPSFPQTVDIETALACQLECPMCTRAQMAKDGLKGVMGFDLYKKIIDECVQNNVFSVKLSWRGEPTMNPRLVDMVAYAKKKGIPDIAFLTNGGKIDHEYATALMDAGLDWISFSIDGMYDEYERIRAPITFDRIVQNVKAIYELKKERNRRKPLVRVQTISGALEAHPEYFDFWRPWVDRISCIAEQPRKDPSRIKHDPDYICQSPFQRVFITWNGIVAPCHGDYHLHHSLGNVKKDSIQNIWSNHRFNKLRRDMRACRRLEYEACRLCPDGGEYIDDHIIVDSRKVGLIRYLEKELTPEEEAEKSQL